MSVFALRTVRDVDNEINNLAFHDLTPASVLLPPALRRLLGLNLNYCPTPSPLSPQDMLDQLPRFVRSLRLRHQFRDTGQQSQLDSRLRSIYVANSSYQPPSCDPNIEATLATIADKLRVTSWQPSKYRNLTAGQRELLQVLQFRPDIQVVLTDKNLGPAVLTRTQYIDLCLDHLLDSTTYERCLAPSTALTKLLKTRVRQFYKTIAKTHITSPDWSTTKIILAGLDDKILNRFYGMPKIHKPVLCVRPIVSNSASIMQGLSKWLHYMLQPYLKRTSTYLRDSDQLIEDLHAVHVPEDALLITFDVVSMYTSIQIDFALHILGQVLQGNPWMDAIILGLRVILTSNYFVFGDLIFHQLDGTAMGTSVAPTFASLFLAYFEETLLCKQFECNLIYFKRYIDDGFIIWKPNPAKLFEFNRFRALLRRSKLKFTFELNSTQMAFLDLWIIRDHTTIATKTHQKALNLHLYLPASSAHPPGVLKGLIFGLIKKYKKQNTHYSDFAAVCRLFHRRLRDRGYHNSVLLPLFERALREATSHRPTSSQVFFKIAYDPNGPSRARIRNLLEFPRLLPMCRALHVDQLAICYLKPPSLKRKLCPTSIRLDCSPTPATRLADRLHQC